MPQDHASLRRSLSILRRLQRGPADRDTLIEQVRVDCGDAADDAVEFEVERKRFENDLKRLRNLGVNIHYYDGDYHFIGYGEFSPVALGEEELNTLAFLGEAFAPGSLNGAAVQRLLQHVADWLPESQRDSIAMRRQRWRIDLRRKDDDVIAVQVQEAIDKATTEHRLLRFGYRSPSQVDGVPRQHTVQPWGLYFDTVRKHLYLEAYCLTIKWPDGVWEKPQWRRYRLGRILADGIQVLPDKFPSIPPKRPRFPLEYLLAPVIARLGEITRHFDDVQVHETDADGWVRVTATTDDLFRAVRLLLGYGPNCKVIGGSEARREMEATIRAMASLYGSAAELA